MFWKRATHAAPNAARFSAPEIASPGWPPGARQAVPALEETQRPKRRSWASWEWEPHEGVWNDDAAQHGLALLDDRESEPLIERLGCAAYVGCQFRQRSRPCLTEKMGHKRSSDALPRMVTRDKEVIDVPIDLEIGVPNNLAVRFGNERVDSAHTLGPHFSIEVLRRPSLNLLVGIVPTGHQVNCGVENVEQRPLFTELIPPDANGAFHSAKCDVDSALYPAPSRR